MAGPRDAVITSVKSTRVIAARRLASRAFRARQRLFLAEGPQAVREAAAEKGLLTELFATADAAARHPAILDAAHAAGATVTIAADEVLASLGDTVAGQGLVGVCRFLDQPLAAVLDRPARLIVLLAHIRDPGNAGSVLRAADAAGADAVLFSAESVDVYNPKVVRTSVGSLFHLPVVIGVDLAEATAALRGRGLRVLAADGSGPADLDDEADGGALAAPTCWMFGNEAWGLPEPIRALADETVRVPIHGRAESLNLATAAAVCLYASARAQRRCAP
ncbi:RNA methyltransferase [Actinospica sp. MGRD01-02]|uniref:RNA methyltransferase n=1 Tax=Actinospica acidithermotolerans TaxID=2828514 RepID=A0A941ED53_9ACTN|nr:RNA methyltransferase [Actinospica acidithermotolerans]MBR7828443.1 RNA methyltransferase [Actinospica acidithermotolerans]